MNKSSPNKNLVSDNSSRIISAIKSSILVKLYWPDISSPDVSYNQTIYQKLSKKANMKHIFSDTIILSAIKEAELCARNGNICRNSVFHS